jgi:hypothetical protein
MQPNPHPVTHLSAKRETAVTENVHAAHGHNKPVPLSPIAVSLSADMHVGAPA